VVLGDLDGALRGVDTLVVWFNKLEANIFWLTVSLDDFCCLIVIYIDLGCVSFAHKKTHMLLISFLNQEPGFVWQKWCLLCNYTSYEETDISTQGQGQDMEGNSPMQLMLTTPVFFLLANAQKQKILVINLSSMLVMRLEDQALLLLPLFLSRIRMDNGWWWMGMGTERDGIVSCAIFLGLIVVLLRPFCCLFKCPFDVTRLGLRYLNVKR